MSSMFIGVFGRMIRSISSRLKLGAKEVEKEKKKNDCDRTKPVLSPWLGLSRSTFSMPRRNSVDSDSPQLGACHAGASHRCKYQMGCSSCPSISLNDCFLEIKEDDLFFVM